MPDESQTLIAAGWTRKGKRWKRTPDSESVSQSRALVLQRSIDGTIESVVQIIRPLLTTARRAE